MRVSKKSASLFFIICMVLIISSCSLLPIAKVSPEISSETVEIIQTDSANTVVAQITLDACLNPSSTPEPVEPSATPPKPTVVDAASAEATSTPTASSTKVYVSKPVIKPAYDCKLIKQNPRDGYPIEADGFFDITWTIQNTGTATWSEDFIYRWWKGDQIAEVAHHMLPRETKPDKTVDLTVDMIAPEELGKYTTWWELVDSSGTRVCKFYASIVVDAPTETVTLTPYY